jgi:hypothetical protein
MHSAVVVVEAPQSFRDEIWMRFCAATTEAESSPAVKQLASHVWLIDVQKSPAAFARFVDACERQKLRYEVLAIETAPQWLPSGFDPKP